MYILNNSDNFFLHRKNLPLVPLTVGTKMKSVKIMFLLDSYLSFCFLIWSMLAPYVRDRIKGKERKERKIKMKKK
jgi:hypothetical protein